MEKVKPLLLNETLKRFPIGTLFISSIDDYIKIREVKSYWNNALSMAWEYIDGNIRAAMCNTGKYNKFCSNPSVYNNGVWVNAVWDNVVKNVETEDSKIKKLQDELNMVKNQYKVFTDNTIKAIIKSDADTRYKKAIEKMEQELVVIEFNSVNDLQKSLTNLIKLAVYGTTD